MSKFFFKSENQKGNIVTFTGKIAHHIAHVQRLKIGQEIILCDGNCTDFYARIVCITKNPISVSFTLSSSSLSTTEASIPITLFQGIPKGDKMEWIIEKSVELGVNKIVPVYMSRSVPKVKDSSTKNERFNRISEAAASQSMRGIVPEVSIPQSFADAISNFNENNLWLVAYENEKKSSLKSIAINDRAISIWVGPEGGFDDYEISTLISRGAIPFSLGPRILRTETAGIAAIAKIMYILEGH